MSSKYQRGSVRSGRSNIFQFRIVFLVLCLLFISMLLLHQLWNANGNKKEHYENTFWPREAYNTTERRTFVSYVMNVPKGSKQQRHEMCRNHVDLFVGRGVAESPFAEFYFSLVGDIVPTKSLLKAASMFYNVKIMFVQTANGPHLVDIISHVRALNALKHQFDDYILLNCGARGPYFPHSSNSRPLKPSLDWTTALFAEKLSRGAGVVGSMVNSVDCVPYVQSHAMAFNRTAVHFALGYWNRLIADNFTDIDRFVVGVSVALLQRGFLVASLDSRMIDVDSRYLRPNPLPVVGRRDRDKDGNGGTMMCHSVDSSVALYGYHDVGETMEVDPCAAGFVLNEAAYDLLHAPPQTVKAVVIEDRKTNNRKPVLCNRLPTVVKPLWDVSKIFDVLTSKAAFVVDMGDNGTEAAAVTATETALASQPFSEDRTSDLAIIVRTHASYATQLLSLLLSIHTSTRQQFRQVRIFVLPTDPDSFEPLHEIISGEEFPWKNPPGVKRPSIRVSLVSFPRWLYDKYGVFLDRMCSPRWKYTALKFNIHTAKLVSRYCDVNSPIHYLLVDLVLHYVLTSIASCQWIVTTNADNFYSPLFFQLVADTNVRSHDVVMANMITKGEPYDTKPYIAGVDLGAYAVSASFLRLTNASFLNSLPSVVDPQSYHDADGHFIEFVRKHDARILKSPGYYFFHN